MGKRWHWSESEHRQCRSLSSVEMQIFKLIVVVIIMFMVVYACRKYPRMYIIFYLTGIEFSSDIS